MPTLFCFGLGYSAEHYIAEYGARFARIAGTVRSIEKAAALTPKGLDRSVTAYAFEGSTAAAGIEPLLDESRALLISVPPGPEGDPVLNLFADAIATSRLESIVYLSTVGVYGDHGGAWVDEETPCVPISERSRERLEAEQDWQSMGQRSGKPVAILRLAGIYGPGQNAFVQLAKGAAKRLDKAGQVFNRIHVADIAQAIEAAFLRRADGIFNVTDDMPTASGEPIEFAARLAGVPAPPAIPFAEAAKSMSPMALSFYAECKRVRNRKLKHELGVTLRYPSYREGLRALFESEAVQPNSATT